MGSFKNAASLNAFPYSDDNKRYHTWAHALSRIFGCRVAKLPVAIAATCPNRNGAKGVGGCIYCSSRGSGEFAGRQGEDMTLQYHRAVGQIAAKWPGAKYIVYFQAFTSTYLPLDRLQGAVEQALALPEVVGIAIATRADCLPPPVLDYLEELRDRTFLTVELGLQTVHDATARRINRCHSYVEFLEGYRALQRRGISVCVHIMAGLPGETPEMMRETARQVGVLLPHSVKLHMLNVLRGTPLGAEYEARPFALMSRDEYISLVCDQLELLPPETIIQRVTGDALAVDLLAPVWTANKLAVRNGIDLELVRRGSMQGARLGATEGT